MNDNYITAFDTKLSTSKATGKISSGINVKLSKVFQDTFVLCFKFKTKDNKKLKMLMPCKDHTEIVDMQSQLKNVRKTHKNILAQYAKLGEICLVERLRSLPNKKVLVSTPRDAFDLNRESDSDSSDSDTSADAEKYGGTVSSFHKFKTLDGETLYEFNLTLLPFLTENAQSGVLPCIINDSDEINRFKNKNKKFKNSNKTFTISAALKKIQLNVVGKPQVYRVDSLDEEIIPNNIIKEHGSQHLGKAKKGMVSFYVVHTTDLVHLEKGQRNGKTGYSFQIDPSPKTHHKVGDKMNKIDSSILLEIAYEEQTNHLHRAFLTISSLTKEMGILTDVTAPSNVIKKHLQHVIDLGYVRVASQNRFPKKYMDK